MKVIEINELFFLKAPKRMVFLMIKNSCNFHEMMNVFCTHVNFGTIGPYFAVLLFQKYGLEKKRVINAWFCEYPSFLVLWCENDCNDAFDAFFIMSTLQSMCNFSALLSVNKPKICFRGPKMNDKNLRQNVTQTSLFGIKINLFSKMRHFRNF